MDIASFELRRPAIEGLLGQVGAGSLEDARAELAGRGVDVFGIVRSVQAICFEDACWAYVLGAILALRRGVTTPADIALCLGEGLQAFCLPNSVADHRKVGLGHGQLAARLLSEETGCFAFLAGHESFAAAEGAIGIARSANRVRTRPLRVILNGLGKDAARIISRVNGFTHVETDFDFATETLSISSEKAFSKGPRSEVRCYGADSVNEGVAIMIHEKVDVAITGNSTNMTRFQHPVLGIYRKWCADHGTACFAVASGGGTGRTVHPDDNGAGPASYGLTDTVGRMYCDAQFAGSSSVPAHVEMMGFIGMGNNPMVGASVALAVALSSMNKE